jgi:hypothetical protein
MSFVHYIRSINGKFSYVMLDFYAMSIFTLSFIIVQNNNHYLDNNFDICANTCNVINHWASTSMHILLLVTLFCLSLLVLNINGWRCHQSQIQLHYSKIVHLRSLFGMLIVRSSAHIIYTNFRLSGTSGIYDLSHLSHLV